MEGLENAIVIMGISQTQLFDGSGGIELILLDLASGQDFTLPVTEEQVSAVLAFKQEAHPNHVDAQETYQEPDPPTPIRGKKGGGKASAGSAEVRDPGEVDQF